MNGLRVVLLRCWLLASVAHFPTGRCCMSWSADRAPVKLHQTHFLRRRGSGEDGREEGEESGAEDVAGAEAWQG